jgi:hypothetical protein
MPANVTDADAFTSPIVVPSAGEGVTAASVLAYVQGLANRTRYLLNRLLPETPVSVVRFVGIPYSVSADAANNGPSFLPFDTQPNIAIGTATRGKLTIGFDHIFPDGAQVTMIRVAVKPVGAQATVGNRMSAQLHVGAATGTAIDSEVMTDDGTNNTQWIEISGANLVSFADYGAVPLIAVTKATTTWMVSIQGSVAPTLDQVFGIEVTFTTSKKFVD